MAREREITRERNVLAVSKREQYRLNVYLPLELQRFQGHNVRREERCLQSLPFADSSPGSLSVVSSPLERRERCQKRSIVARPQEWCFLKETSKQHFIKMWLLLTSALNLPLKLINSSCDWQGNPFPIRSTEHQEGANGGSEWESEEGRDETAVAQPPKLGAFHRQETTALYWGRKSLIRNFVGKNDLQERKSVLGHTHWKVKPYPS